MQSLTSLSVLVILGRKCMLVASGKSHEYAPTGPTDRQSYSQILVLVRFNRQTDRQM